MKLPIAFAITLCLNLALYFGVSRFDIKFKRFRNVDRVVLFLQWYNQAQFAGFYVAKEKNFYDQHNLDVTILPRPDPAELDDRVAAAKRANVPIRRDPNWSVPYLVGTTTMAFGVWPGDQILKGYDRDPNWPIKAIGVVFDRSLACFMVREENNPSEGILSPVQFAGKRVGVYKDYDTDIIYNWMMLKYAPSAPNKPIYLDAATSHLAELKQGGEKGLDVLAAYVINEPLQVDFPVHIITPDTYNIPYYSDTLIANDSILAQNADIAKRFLIASEEGWRWALENQKAAATIVVSNQDPDHPLSEAQQSIVLAKIASYVQPNESMFEMHEDVWQSMSYVVNGNPHAKLKMQRVATSSAILRLPGICILRKNKRQNRMQYSYKILYFDLLPPPPFLREANKVMSISCALWLILSMVWSSGILLTNDTQQGIIGDTLAVGTAATACWYLGLLITSSWKLKHYRDSAYQLPVAVYQLLWPWVALIALNLLVFCVALMNSLDPKFPARVHLYKLMFTFITAILALEIPGLKDLLPKIEPFRFLTFSEKVCQSYWEENPARGWKSMQSRLLNFRSIL